MSQSDRQTDNNGQTDTGRSVIFVNENENENYQKRKITIPLTKTKTKTKKYWKLKLN